MEYVVTIILMIGFIIYLNTLSSQKATVKERLGEAIGNLARSSADSIANFAYNITEPKDKKRIRKATESLAMRNRYIYGYSFFSHPEFLEQYFTIDSSFQETLNTLGIPNEKWQAVALKLFYIGVIREASRDSNDYSKQVSPSLRKHIIEDWPNDKFMKPHFDYLAKALEYFHISKEEWVDFGDNTLVLRHVFEDEDLRTIGVVASIMPTKNNSHLL